MIKKRDVGVRDIKQVKEQDRYWFDYYTENNRYCPLRPLPHPSWFRFLDIHLGLISEQDL